MLVSPFNRLPALKTCNFLKNRLKHRCFSVNIAKISRNLLLIKICEQLLLPFLLFTVNISSQGLVSALKAVGLLQRYSSMFKEFFLGCLLVGSSIIWKKEKLAKMVTCCHSLSFVVPVVVTRCHSSFIVQLVITRCTTRCHSLSLVVPLSLSLDVVLVCLFIIDRVKITCC